MNNYYNGIHPFIVIDAEDVEASSKIIFDYHGCRNFVIIAENQREIFENLENRMRFEMPRFNDRRYLFLPIDGAASAKSIEIFESPAIKYVSDVLIITANVKKINDLHEEVIFDFYTHKYVGDENEVSEILWSNRWYSVNESFLFDKDLYSDKLKNQLGKELRIATFTYKPYSIPASRDGTELLVALEYAQRHNMTPTIILDEIGQWGEVFDNWTGYGIIGNLAMDKGDVGLGALYTWEHDYHFLDLSKPVLRSGITCIAPGPKLATGLATPFLSFSISMWIMVAVSYFVGSASFYLVFALSPKEDTRNNSKNLLLSFMMFGRILLLQSFQKMPNMQQSRLIFSFSLILSLLLTTIYGSGLSSNMTIPRYYGIIRDVNDLVDSGLHWGATSTAWISSIQSSPSYKEVVDAFLVLDEEALEKLNDEEFVYSVERLQAGNFAIGEYVTLKGAQKRRLLEKDLYFEYCVLMLRKNSILLPTMNDLILQISQSGLIHFWEYKVVSRHLDSNLQKAVHEATHLNKLGSEITKLGLSHVAGAFLIWAIGLILSSCVLLFELFVIPVYLK